MSQVRPGRSAGRADFQDVALDRVERRRSSGRPQEDRPLGVDAEEAGGRAEGKGGRGARREEAAGGGGEGGAGEGGEDAAGKGELPQVDREEEAAGGRPKGDARERVGIAEASEGDRG